MGWADIAAGPDYLSASQLSMWSRCAKQYEFRYIRGIKRPPNLSMIIGTSMHKSAEVNYISKFKTKKPVKISTALDACSDEFQEQKSQIDPVGKKELGAGKDRAIAMAKAHYTQIAPFNQPVAAPELEFKVQIPGLTKKLLGYIDVIAAPIVKRWKSESRRAGTEYEVVLPKRFVRDNKTSGRKFDKLAVELSQQLTGYAYAHKILFGRMPDGVGLDIMVAKKEEIKVEVQCVTTTRTQAELDRFASAAVQIEKGIKTGIFPPVDDAKTCSWCAYRPECQPAALKRGAMTQWK